MQTADSTPFEKVLPEGQLVNRTWLKEHGFSRPRVDAFIRSQKLEIVVRGVYRRPGPPIKWQQVVYSLGQMGIPIYVGGYSALELLGMTHYMDISGTQKIDLYGARKVPDWVKGLKGETSILDERTDLKGIMSGSYFRVHTRVLMHALPVNAITYKPFGAWDWSIPYAVPELAIIEHLDSLSEEADFRVVDKLFEAGAMLRPELLNNLLIECKSVKVKRLFFWFSARHGYPWFGELDRERINLGNGKRHLIKSGVFDKEYSITVPKDMARGNQEPIF